MLGTQGQPLARVETGELGKLHAILFCSIHVWGSIRGANKTPRPGNKILRVYLMYDYETSDLSVLYYVSCMVKLEMELQMTLKHTAYVAFKT